MISRSRMAAHCAVGSYLIGKVGGGLKNRSGRRIKKIRLLP